MPPKHICIVPRGVVFKVGLSGPSRGYILEVFQGHFELPDLGPIGSNGLARPIASSMRALRPGDRIRVGHVELAVRQLPAHGLPTTDGTGAWPAAPPSCLRTRKVCSISSLVLAVDRALRSPLHVKASAPAVPHQRPHLNPPRPTTPAPYSAANPLPSLPTSLLPHPLSPRAHPFPSYPKPSHVLTQPVPARLHLLKPAQD